MVVTSRVVVIGSSSSTSSSSSSSSVDRETPFGMVMAKQLKPCTIHIQDVSGLSHTYFINTTLLTSDLSSVIVRNTDNWLIPKSSNRFWNRGHTLSRATWRPDNIENTTAHTRADALRTQLYLFLIIVGKSHWTRLASFGLVEGSSSLQNI